MNCPSELSGDNPHAHRDPAPNTLEFMIVKSLGYCCEVFFWECFRELPSDLIAARFGLARSTITRHRQWFNEGRFLCCNLPTCLKRRLDASRRKEVPGAATPGV